MKVRCLSQEEHERTRVLYEEIFTEDEKAFVDAYYAIKAKDNVILAVEEEGELVAMLHRNPYAFRLRENVVQADYIVAVATRKEFRHQGLMCRLLIQALQDMYMQKQPFAFLMPAAEAIYRPFDFRPMGNHDAAKLGSCSQEELAEAFDLYVEKDADYRRRHIPWPGWEATPLMMRLVHLKTFVKGIGAKEAQSLILAVEDPILSENNGVFCWDFTTDGSRLFPTANEPELRIGIADLGSFLFGRLAVEAFGEECFLGNAEERKVVKAKLSRIRVLRKVYINETV